MRFLVLGGGTQGSAAAYDLLQDKEVESVLIADLEPEPVHGSLQSFLGGRLSLRSVDASDETEVRSTMQGMDGVLCALPYHFNHKMASLALESGCHYTDLGGNTKIVRSQKQMDGSARERGLSLVPDTGLAPGLVNVLAQAGINSFESVNSVRMWVGGLPQEPKPPLNYQIVYSLHGVIDYYVTPAVVLRNGEHTTVPALSGLALVEFPKPVGQLEAFYTAGGVSTLPDRYHGQVDVLEYKTLRYPGHARIVAAIRDLGLFSDQPVSVGNVTVAPRDVFIESATPALTGAGAGDLVVARVEVTGLRQRQPATIRYDLIDYFDRESGFSAMARTTGFSLSITALMQARGQLLSTGAATPDEVVPPELYVSELAERGVRIVKESV